MATSLRVATAGSVDDGKSTLIGRLLVDAKQVLEDQLDAVRRSSARDDGELNLAFLTDGLKAERERGITIDVAYRYFATPRRRFILADTPGHEEFTRNTVTGASNADAFIVLVDARHGLVTQSRRHTAIGVLLHVPHLILAVNKMDLVGYDETVFRSLAAEWRELAGRVGAEDVHTVPISALRGDNVVEPSTEMPWYDGPALLPLLERLDTLDHAEGGGLRFLVQRVMHANGGPPRLAGQVERGRVRPGDPVTVLPAGDEARVARIELLEEALDEVAAPRSVSLVLDGAEARRGDVVAAADGHLPTVATQLEATLCWLDETPLETGAHHLLKLGTRTVGAVVAEIEARVRVTTLERTPAEGTLKMNDLGDVAIRLDAPVAVDAYRESRYTGSFILIDERTNGTVAAGMVTAAR
jgi:sulfate adenylyltransferase large subunit